MNKTKLLVAVGRAIQGSYFTRGILACLVKNVDFSIPYKIYFYSTARFYSFLQPFLKGFLQ
jgi:hypothetical protein